MPNYKTIQRLIIISFVLIIYLFIVLQYSRRFAFNFTGFACLSGYSHVEKVLPYKSFVHNNTIGYDGQYFLLMCHDPFITSWPKNFIDVSAYRYQRIMYPLTAILFAFGNEQYFPYSLVIVNLSAIYAGTILVLLMLKKQNLSLWYGIFYSSVSGLILCVLRDLAEPLTIMFMLGAFYCYSIKRYYLFFLSISCMLLCKEVMLLLIPLFMYDALFIKKDKKLLFLISGSIIPWILWQIYVTIKCHMAPCLGGTGNFGIPFIHAYHYVYNVLKAPSSKESLKWFVSVFTVTVVFSLILSVKEIIKSVNIYTSSFFVFSVFFIFMSDKVWIEPWSFVRIYIPAGVLMLLNFINTKDKIYLFPLFCNVILFGISLWWVELF